MEKKFSNNEILEAVDYLLEENFKKIPIYKKSDHIPRDTEEIILQAEKYLKKD